MDNGIENQNVYAEVLYAFKAVGAEELSLERGALVEVLRMESGPWWWGNISFLFYSFVHKKLKF